MSKREKKPSKKSVREASLNLTEAKAHLSIVGKALRDKNPVAVEKVKKAKKLYSDFHIQDSRYIREYKVDVNAFHNSLENHIGPMTAIEYTTVRAGKVQHFRHDFLLSACPVIYAISSKNRFVLIRSVLGRFNFGKRGFVDRKGFKKANSAKPDYSALVEVGTLDAYEFLGNGLERIVIPVRTRPILAVNVAGTAIYTLKK